jgi:hypothetical protein
VLLVCPLSVYILVKKIKALGANGNEYFSYLKKINQQVDKIETFIANLQ